MTSSYKTNCFEDGTKTLDMPTGVGRMGLSQALLWIATKGGARSETVVPGELFASAFEELLSHVPLGKNAKASVAIYGTSPDGLLAELSAELLHSAILAPPDGLDALFDETHPTRLEVFSGDTGADAVLWVSGVPAFTVLAASADIRHHWDFDTPMQTGTPGRPSVRHTAIALYPEMAAAPGFEIPRLKKHLAKCLIDFFAARYPLSGKPKPKSLQGTIEFRTLWTSINNAEKPTPKMK